MATLPNWRKKLTHRGQSLALLLALVALAGQGSPLLAAEPALVPGDLVFTGYITNGAVDSFSFVTLVPLRAGTEIYFTDTGWTGTNFFEVSDINADGERLTRLTVNQPLAAGAIIRSNDGSLDFTWTITGAIGAGGNYAELAFGQQGDQITALQSTNSTNPLLAGFTALAQIDYTGVFEPAINNGTGDVVPNLAPAAGTAILFNNLAPYAAFTLNTLPAGSPSEWRTAIQNPANWTFDTRVDATLPTGALAVNSPASIITQPASQTIAIDTAATMSVVAGGAGPLSYQWYLGNTGDASTPIAGATTASFTTPVLSTTTNYWVRVSNNLGSVDSATVTVTVIVFEITAVVYLPLVFR